LPQRKEKKMPSEKALELAQMLRGQERFTQSEFSLQEAAELIDKAIAEAVKEATAPLVAALEYYAVAQNHGVALNALGTHRARAESAKKEGV